MDAAHQFSALDTPQAEISIESILIDLLETQEQNSF